MRGQRTLFVVLLLGIVSIQPGATQEPGSPGTLTVDALVMQAMAGVPDSANMMAEVVPRLTRGAAAFARGERS